MKDNLVSETVVAEPPLAATGVLANGLGPRRLMPFRLFLSTSITVGGGAVDAYDGVLMARPEPASPTSVGGGTMVGWLVSMTTRSGGCRMEAIRMIGLLLAPRAGSGKDLGRHQSATNSKARSDVPTQIMNRPIGITISHRHATWREQTPQFLTVRNCGASFANDHETWLLLEIPTRNSEP